jgi:hypothetical protein
MAVPVPSISCCALNHHNLFYQIHNALLFNRDTCCHLALSVYGCFLSIKHLIVSMLLLTPKQLEQLALNKWFLNSVEFAFSKLLTNTSYYHNFVGVPYFQSDEVFLSL